MGIVPKLTMTSPLPNSSNIPLNQEIVLSFNKEMLPSSLNKFTVVLIKQDENKIIPGSYRYLRGVKKLYFKPERLSEATTYQLQIKNGIKDAMESPLQNPKNMVFKTIDLTPPSITYTSPKDKSENISSDSLILVRFSEALNIDSINPKNIYLASNKKKIPSEIIYQNILHSIRINPEKPLKPGTYQLIMKSLQDTSTNTMKTSILSFTVSPPLDTDPPYITKSLPNDNQESFGISDPIRLYLNETVKGFSVNGLNLSLFNTAKNKLVKCRLLYNKKKNMIEIFPLKPLDYLTKFTLKVKNLQDLTGNLSKKIELSFTTKKAPDMTPPSIVSFNYSKKKSPLRPELRIRFSEPLKAGLINEKSLFIRTTDDKLLNGGIKFILPDTIVFRSIHTLKYETKYSIIVFKDDISDRFGNHPKDNIKLPFLTIDKPDKAAPYIVSSNPKDGSRNIAVNTQFIVKFNEPLMKESVDIYSILLFRNGETILGDIKYLDSKHTIIFSPRSDLEYNSSYSLLITEKICDKYENYINPAQTLHFFTEKEPDRISPRIIYTSPIPGAINVKKDSLITVRFSEPIDQDTLNEFTIRLTSGNKNIPIKIDYNKKLSKLIISPQKELEYNANYRLSLKKAITDIAGNFLLNDKHVDFKVEPEPDKEPPVLLSITPESGNQSIDINKSIKLIFNEPLDELSVNEFTVTLQDLEKKQSISGIVNYNASACSIEFIPAVPLFYDSKYKLVISPDISDIYGNKIGKPIETDYKTMVSPDHTRPEIIKTVPKDLAIDIPVDSIFKIFFSEKINTMTLNEFTVSLRKKDDSSKVPINLKYSTLNNSISIKPKKELKYYTKYQIIVSRMVEDLAGNCLASTNINSFLTKHAPDNIPPMILSSIPKNNSSNSKIDIRPTVVFTEKILDKTINRGNIFIKHGSDNDDCELSYDSNKNTLTIIPLKPLKYDTKYNIYFTNSITDIAGNNLPSNQVVSFKTKKKPDTQRPYALKTLPDSGDLNISIMPIIRVFFNEALMENTINSNNITLSDGDVFIPGKIDYKKIKKYIEFRPAAKLEYSRTYHFMISDVIKDLAGNPLKNPVIIEFTTTLPPDIQPPRVISIFPLNKSINNSNRQKIKLAFSEQLKESSINNYTVFLRGRSGLVNTQISYSPLERMITLIPQIDMLMGEKYTISITNGVTDIAGNGLENPKSSDFYVGRPRDLKAPVVMFTSPENNADKVSSNCVITATFSSSIDKTTLNRFTMIVQDGSRNIKGKILYNSALKRAEFYPEKTLARGKRYAVTITNGIKGENGIDLKENTKWFFRVADYN